MHKGLLEKFRNAKSNEDFKQRFEGSKIVLTDKELDQVSGGSVDFNDAGGACQAIPAINSRL